ncbi:DUF2917 domain-containing protein [Chitinolyticbacter meiyuanensis]|uniref:DUF2917 domain-containing protein n=1 Tax=Chitinolyticbacter meiyuanensis TaxID=682798 RepID=UPI0011E5CF99|nr:DUF2917 domain-containing protein [Chitinolyticbacter meiyuanensis]
MMTCKLFPVTGRNLLRLELEAPTRLRCHAGTLWLTHDGDTLDHVLSAGMQLEVSGLVLIEGEGELALNDLAIPAETEVEPA